MQVLIPHILKPFGHLETVFLGPDAHSSCVHGTSGDAGHNVPLEVVRVSIVHEAIDRAGLVGSFSSSTIQGECEAFVLDTSLNLFDSSETCRSYQTPGLHLYF